MSDSITPLDRRWDRENESTVIVTAVHDSTADSFMTGTYNWRKEELSVADFDKNQEYPPDDTVVSAVYLESLQEAGESADVTLDRISELVEAGEVDEYAFPVSRLAEPSSVDKIDA